MKQLMNALKNAGYLGIGTLVIAGEGVVYAVAKGKMAYTSYQNTVHECSEAEYQDDMPFDDKGYESIDGEAKRYFDDWESTVDSVSSQ